MSDGVVGNTLDRVIVTTKKDMGKTSSVGGKQTTDEKSELK